MLLTPLPPVTNCHTFSDPLPLEREYFMDGPIRPTDILRHVEVPAIRRGISCVSHYLTFISLLERSKVYSLTGWGTCPHSPRQCKHTCIEKIKEKNNSLF